MGFCQTGVGEVESLLVVGSPAAGGRRDVTGPLACFCLHVRAARFLERLPHTS